MIFNEIQAQKHFLSKVEKKIADIILNNPEEFISCSAIELSKLAEVSQGSINNFSKKFVQGGFSELKTKLAIELNEYKGNFFNIVSESDHIKDVLNTAAKNLYVAFQQTTEINSEKTLKKASEMIIKANKIDIYGVGQSGIVAHDYAYHLIKLGIRANAVTDVLMCSVSATTLDSNSLLIVIAASGKTKDMYDAVKIAKKNNVPCICITRDKNAPISKLCDVVIVVSTATEPLSRVHSTSRLCQYFIIDALCSYIRYQENDDGSKRYFDVTEILQSHSMELTI